MSVTMKCACLPPWMADVLSKLHIISLREFQSNRACIREFSPNSTLDSQVLITYFCVPVCYISKSSMPVLYMCINLGLLQLEKEFSSVLLVKTECSVSYPVAKIYIVMHRTKM